MRFLSETTADGVSEHHFVLGDITGVLWSPAGADGDRPLILLAHGGGRHKKAPGLLARAHHHVTTGGFAVAAIDAPGHGDRPRTADDEAAAVRIREAVASGGPVAPLVAAHNAALATRAVPEWRATLDALLEDGRVGPDVPVGFWGLSLGTAVGVPLVAAEPRVTAAVFGLLGHESLADAAARITVPVRFLLQWDDELVPRSSSLALFDAFASRDRTLHANPGRHMELPRSEVESEHRFFAGRLARASGARQAHH
ncbi:lysophospholipase [Actinacidiphila glaucinigra]|uniref:alpha/beta hydrolase n=1 Tax=Actinacidiphila glaucinigra TaxID=235986 RepID=UPI0032469E6B